MPKGNMVTKDEFLGGKLLIQQPSQGHRSGHDAVLLAASVPESARHICELGSGVGVASLCAAFRLGHVNVTGVEVNQVHYHLAQENTELNQLSSRVQFICDDIYQKPEGLKAAQFDHVFFNPPFYAPAQVKALEDASKEQAHHIEADHLDKWFKYAAYLLKAKASLSVIHRADAIDMLLPIIKRRFGGLKILPIYGRNGQSANRIIISGQRDSKAVSQILPPLYLQNEAGGPSVAAEAILRGGAALAL